MEPNQQGIYHKKKIDNKCGLIIQSPQGTKMNNLKTSKYFNNEAPSSTKAALSSYRENNQSISTSTESLTVIDNSNLSSNSVLSKIRKSSLVIDKELIKYTEPKCFAYKLEPKKFEENVESDSDDDDISESLPVYTKNKSLGHVASRNNDSFNSNLTQDKINTTDIEQLEIKIPDDITFNSFLSIDKLYQDLTKDIEINKMEIPQNKLSIIKDFFTIMNDKEYQPFQIFDCQFTNNVQKVCKEHYLLEIIFICILFLINNLKKKDKETYLAGIKNCIFYFHQNSLVCLFVIVSKTKGSALNEDFIKCSKKIEENRSWLNRTNYKRCITNNNKIIKGIIKNIVMQMKQSGSSFNDQQLNLFTSTIKSTKKAKLEGVLNELYREIILKELSSNQSNDEDNEETQALKPSVPFLSANVSKKEYTLVLDLDETLAHFIEDEVNGYILVRPGAEDFIDELGELFELILFTAAKKSYADIVIDELDSNQKISGRLYRQHTLPSGSANIKDLSKLGRDLTKVIIVENCADNFSLQPLNGIHIKDFEGDENDEELDMLKEELIKLVKEHPDDVKDYLPKITIPMKNRYQKEKESIKGSPKDETNNITQQTNIS